MNDLLKNPILSVKNLNAWFGDFHAIKNVSVDYPEKTITAIIGPSGCGKSTYLRWLNRINEETPTARADGQIIFNDQNILDPDIDPVKVRRSIGMVFQKPNPFPAMSIYDNVVIGLRLQGIRKKAILDEVVETCLKKAALWDEVKDKLDELGTSLSGGQQQRLCIARTIAVNPPIVLMDEPTSALDPIATSKIEELMTDLRKDYTVVIVTHNMQQAARIADNTTFLLLGELIEHGTSDQIFNNPSQIKTQEYIAGKFS